MPQELAEMPAIALIGPRPTSSNQAVCRFDERLAYEVGEWVSMGKRLVPAWGCARRRHDKEGFVCEWPSSRMCMGTAGRWRQR